MSKLKTLKDGLLDQLKDLYSAENQLLKALPKMEKKASNASLQDAFGAHLGETEQHLERLNVIGTILQSKLSGKTCKAMQGLIEEGKEVIEEESENDALIDVLLIAAAQRVEHYEIAAYGTARAIAEELGEEEVVTLLQQTLDEEKDADKKLTQICEQEILAQAAGQNDDAEEQDDSPKRATSKKSSGVGKRPSTIQRMLAVMAYVLLFHHGIGTASADTNKQHITNENEAVQYKADNTGRNLRDKNPARTTADDQNLSGKDLEVLTKIRKEIIANNNLSLNGHNVKILVENGSVILRGPVQSAAEKSWIEKAASGVASGYGVVNQLEIAPG